MRRSSTERIFQCPQGGSISAVAGTGNGGDDRGPGHNGWFSSPTGSETWIVYHGTAANESARSSRAMRIPFNGSGWPVVPRPPPLGARLAEPR